MLEEQLLEHLERAVETQLVATTHPVPFEIRLVQRLDRSPRNRHPPFDHRFSHAFHTTSKRRPRRDDADRPARGRL